MLHENPAGYAATQIACGRSEMLMKKTNQTSGQDQQYKNVEKAVLTTINSINSTPVWFVAASISHAD